MAPPDSRPGKSLSFDEAGHRSASLAYAEPERVVGGGLGVPEHPRQQPADGLGHDQHGWLSSGQHVVTDTDLVDAHPRPGIVADPAVNALIPATGEYQPRLSRIPGGTLLGERHAGRRRYHQQRPSVWFKAGSGDLVQRLAPRLGLHHHAGAAPERRIIHRVMHVARPASQVMDAKGDIPAVSRLADQRNAERPEVLGEDRDDVDPQRVTSALTGGIGIKQPRRRVYPQQPGRHVHLGHDG